MCVRTGKMCQATLKNEGVDEGEHSPSSSSKHVSVAPYVSQQSKRGGWVDLCCFLLPALLYRWTDIKPIYVTGLLRIVSTHAFLTGHYLYVDKDNYMEKLSQKQLQREKKDYLVGIILHMWAQAVLQLLLPGMFFPVMREGDSTILRCAVATLSAHILLVEPLYYAVHRWLHVPDHMKKMHGFHHQSINTVPSTSLVQNFQEHFIYIATFGPAFLLPFFVLGVQHWAVVAGYLVMFDLVNAYGHTNIKIRHPIFTHKYSPLTYLIYTPEFHLGHHAYYNYNFALFMPLWDHLLGTYRKYDKAPPKLLPAEQQDFVFIGHNGGLGHLLTVPEFSVYNVYDSYRRTWLPIEVELLLVMAANAVISLFSKSYRVTRYLVNGQFVGRIICILRTPLDYMRRGAYAGINRDIVRLMRDENERCGTRYFGLGNLNKMKALNNGGVDISRLVAEDPVLRNRNIRVWTGDTLTTASVYHQVMALPFDSQSPEERCIFYIGAGGKIGKAVCQLLAAQGVRVVIYSKHVASYASDDVYSHPLISYTQELKDMLPFKFVLIGKLLRVSKYERLLRHRIRDQFLLDYTVPFMPINTAPCDSAFTTHHAQIGVLRCNNEAFLRGYYDICMGTAQNHIYPCHAGCIINMVDKLERDETGEINVDDVVPLWNKALAHGLVNKDLSDIGL